VISYKLYFEYIARKTRPKLRLFRNEIAVLNTAGFDDNGCIGWIRVGRDWFDYRLEHDARFLRRIEQARNSLRAGAE